MPTPRKTASDSASIACRTFGESIRTPRAKRTPSSARASASSGSGSRMIRYGSDREPDETARLLPRVVDGDRVAAHGELAGARQPGRPGPEDGDAVAVLGHAHAAERDAGCERPVGRVPLEARDLDRPASLVQEHAGAFAELLDRADACAASRRAGSRRRSSPPPPRGRPDRSRRRSWGRRRGRDTRARTARWRIRRTRDSDPLRRPPPLSSSGAFSSSKTVVSSVCIQRHCGGGGAALHQCRHGRRSREVRNLSGRPQIAANSRGCALARTGPTS